MGAATVASCTVEPNLLQMFVMAPSGAVMTDESVCLDAPERDHSTLQPKVRIMACSGLGRQKWSYNDQVSCWKILSGCQQCSRLASVTIFVFFHCTSEA
jgi:hypothetical protein